MAETIRVQTSGPVIVASYSRLVWWTICCITVLGFSLGAGAVSMVPWLARQSAWSSARAEMMAENMMDAAAKCEGRVMVLERACPMAVRARAAAKNVGGEQ